jgi:voltage-gated potassium channel
VEHETRVERRLDRLIGRADSPRKAAVVIATVTTAISIIAGVLMVFLDKDNFPTVGDGLWWSVQTVTTVGYGDITPSTTAGRLLGAVVMLLGIGFLTVITASITGAFVTRSQHERDAGGKPEPLSESHLQEIQERLERIEAMLRERV